MSEKYVPRVTSTPDDNRIARGKAAESPGVWKVYTTRHGDYYVTNHEGDFGHVAYHLSKADAELVVAAVNAYREKA